MLAKGVGESHTDTKPQVKIYILLSYDSRQCSPIMCVARVKNALWTLAKIIGRCSPTVGEGSRSCTWTLDKLSLDRVY